MMKGYEVWGRIDEGCSEFLGLFTDFRKAEREAKQASRRYPLGADIDFCKEKDTVPSTSRKVAMILKKRGVRVIRSSKEPYYCIEIKGHKICRELINNIEE